MASGRGGLQTSLVGEFLMQNPPSDYDAKRVAHWREVLRANGYRITPTREAVLRALSAGNYALEATEIFERARRFAPHLGLVTVYRTLDAMLSLGLVERVHCTGQCSLYVAAEEGHHHILVCRKCRRVWHFSGDDLTNLMNDVANESGFVIEDHWLQLVGLCPECRDS